MINEVINIISETLEIPKDNINENTNLIKDLEIESLDLVDLVSAFEEKYKIEIKDSDIKNFVTVGDIVKYLKEHV